MKIKYSLVGQDGNAYVLMGYTARAMKEQKFTKAEVDEVMKKAKSGDYNNLIAELCYALHDCNKRAS